MEHSALMAEPDTMGIDAFVTLSAGLTGFDAAELRGTGMADRYHALVVAETGGSLYRRLVAAVATSDDPADVADPHLLDLARRVTRLWYLGVWPGARAFASPRAYAHGLVWRTFHGAAPGTAAPGFGSWARPPRRQVLE
jgi:hypothetical protein